MRLQERPRGFKLPVLRGSKTARLLQKIHGLDNTAYRRHITECTRQAEKTGQVRLKPGRVLGASWMDPFVEQRRAVNLCGFCVTKYGKALLSRHYRIQPPWIVDIYSDCDGCGASTLKVSRYIPEEKFFQYLIGASGKNVSGGSK